MEPGYLVAICLGCLGPNPIPLLGPIVPDAPAVRVLKPEDYRTRCFDHLALPDRSAPSSKAHPQSIAKPSTDGATRDR